VTTVSVGTVASVMARLLRDRTVLGGPTAAVALIAAGPAASGNLGSRLSGSSLLKRRTCAWKILFRVAFLLPRLGVKANYSDRPR